MVLALLLILVSNIIVGFPTLITALIKRDLFLKKTKLLESVDGILNNWPSDWEI